MASAPLTSAGHLPSTTAQMKSDGIRRHLLTAFVLTLVFYVLVYTGLEHLRHRKGPWRVTFTTAGASPALVVNQSALRLTNVQLRFPGEPAPTNSAETVVFERPRPVPFAVPFGSCIFMDATFLPGTVTFRMFGHEIELLPRVLIIDHEEHRWVSGSSLALEPVKAAAETKRP